MLLASAVVLSPASDAPGDGLPTVRLSALPPEAAQVVEPIARDGPFDGADGEIYWSADQDRDFVRVDR